MKKNYFLTGCLIFIVLAVIAFFLGLNMPKRHLEVTYSKPTKTGTWLQISPMGMVPDYNEIAYNLRGNNYSVQDLCAKITTAATDKNIKGILIRPYFSQISQAGINEIAEALKVFKQSKKPVLACMEMNNQRDYLLAALADSIAMDPAASAGLFLEGVSTNITFYKNLLDKVGLKVNVIRSGAFKSYGEPYSNTVLSKEARNNLSEVLSDRYNLLINYIAARRNLSPEQVKAVFEQRPDYIVSAQYAKAAGLIDLPLGRDDFLKRNGITKKDILDIINYNSMQPEEKGEGKIALCYLQGSIAPYTSAQLQEGISSAKIQKMISAIEADKQIKAVVLRVNSPGGSALESEIIYRKLAELKVKIPIIISMSGTAASGGYYICSASDYIIADPSTITGSIGVIQLLPDASKMSNKIGITNETISFGKYAGAVNPMNPPSKDLIASFQRNSEAVYSEFKQRVAANRKIDYNSLENLAGGRVWSAEDALQNHLIDQIGTLDTAIKKAAEMAHLKTYQTVILPERKQYFQVLAEQIRRGQVTRTNQHFASFEDLLSDQLQSILKPYTALCLMPFNLE
ncbi:MAG: signal peptide peptidase SppA [Candidatus Cloacimonadaceae bacterium]